MADVLELPENNLYRNGTIIVFDDGTEDLERTEFATSGQEQDVYHLVQVDDRLDRLAYRYYSAQVEDASKYYWLIADANNIENPLDLSELVGTEILIPNVLNAKFDV